MAKIANERYSLFPIKHPEFFEFYNTMIKLNWFAFEIDVTKDQVALAKMDKNELHFIFCPTCLL